MATLKHELETATDTVDQQKKARVNEEAEENDLFPAPIISFKGIQEEDVGITEYLSNISDGFSGILKQRYYDFLVNEIDVNGNEVHLTDEGVQNRKERRREKREIEKQYKTQEPQTQSASTQKSPTPPMPLELTNEHRIALLTAFGEDDLNKLIELPLNGGYMESEKSFSEKAERGKVHQLIRIAFEGKLETTTTEENRFKIVFKPRRFSRRQPNNQQQQVDNERDHEGDFGLGAVKNHLLMTMYKENKETMEVAALLARFLKIPTRWVRYAGTKDRRGVTVQRLSIERLRATRVNSLNKILKGIRIGTFAYSDIGLQLGDLTGNSFLITIKDVQPYNKDRSIAAILKDSIESLGSRGFINYFGMQRFGTFSVSTHIVGIKLLQGDWKAAAELLLAEQELVLPDSIEARKIWAETKNASRALNKMPRKCNAEWCILDTLSKEKSNVDGEYSAGSYFTAISKIPRNLRIMYGHAYQSYIWNSVVSRRMKMFGLEVVVGDLVIENSQSDAAVSEVAAAEDEDESDSFDEDVKKARYTRARPVTPQEVADGTFTIYDVVLPTPGFDVVYPTNSELKQVYEELMKADGLDPYNMSRKVREFSLAGSYRNILSRPSNLTYYIRHYHTNDETLVKSDLDVLKANKEFQKKQIDELLEKKADYTEKEMDEKIEAIMQNRDFPKVERIADGDESGPKTAIIVKMNLGVSSYATMALRELMKKDISQKEVEEK